MKATIFSEQSTTFQHILKHGQKDILAMVHQLGVPALFLTVSSRHKMAKLDEMPWEINR